MEGPISNSSRPSTPSDVGLDAEDTPLEEAVSFHHLLCSNKDPNACAICSNPFEQAPQRTVCCGSRYCENCRNQSLRWQYDEKSVKLCAVCRKKAPITPRDIFRMQLSAARKGQAWAQFEVAVKLGKGCGADQSHNEAVYWYKKAAEQGHPKAFTNLGTRYKLGKGCSANLSEAERYYRMAADLHEEFHRNTKYRAISNLALLIAGRGRGEEARDLLLPFAAEGHAGLQNSLGVVYVREFSNREEAITWYRSAAIQGHSTAAQNLVASYMRLGHHALAKFWMTVVMKIGKGVREGTLSANMKALRRDGEHCGACDKKLGTPKQNMCKQCRTYCYCDRKCQIRHWNRAHKIDCKEVGKLKETEDELFELFKNEPDDWFA